MASDRGSISSRNHSPTQVNRSNQSKTFQHQSRIYSSAAFQDHHHQNIIQSRHIAGGLPINSTTRFSANFVNNNNNRTPGANFSSRANSTTRETTFAKTYINKSTMGQDKSHCIGMIHSRIRQIESECQRLKTECNFMQKDVAQHHIWKRRNEVLESELEQLNSELASYNLYYEVEQPSSASHSWSAPGTIDEIQSDLVNRIKELEKESKMLQERLETTLKFKKNSDQEKSDLASRLKQLDKKWEQMKEKCQKESVTSRNGGIMNQHGLDQLDDRLKKLRMDTNRYKKQLNSLEIKIRTYEDESEIMNNKRLKYIDQVIKLRRLQQEIRRLKNQGENNEGAKKLNKEDLIRLQNTRNREKEAIAALKKQTEDLKSDLKHRKMFIESLRDEKFISNLVKGCLEIEKFDKFCEEYETAIKKVNSTKLSQLNKEMNDLREAQRLSMKYIKILEDSASSRDKRSLMEIINIKRRLEIDILKLDSLKPKYDSEIARFQDEIRTFKEEESSISDPLKEKIIIEKKLSDTETSLVDLRNVKKQLERKLIDLETTHAKQMNNLEEMNNLGLFPTGLEAKDIRDTITLRDDCYKLHDRVIKRINNLTEVI